MSTVPSAHSCFTCHACQLSDNFSKLMLAVGASTRVFQIVDRQPAIPVSGGRQLPEFSGTVSFQDVRFSYPQRPNEAILEGFSLDLQPGKVVALVGESGSGKSTVASLLTRLYDVDEGDILLDGTRLVVVAALVLSALPQPLLPTGVPLGELDPTWVRQNIGIVSQVRAPYGACWQSRSAHLRPAFHV